MIKSLCMHIKGLIINCSPLFSNSFPIENLTIKKGVATISNLKGNKGDIIGIEGVNGSNATVNTSHVLISSNSFTVRANELINTNMATGKVHNNIRVIPTLSEELAFNHFKANPNNIIFIIPQYKQGLSLNTVKVYFDVILYLWDKNSILTHIESINSLENKIIKITSLLKIKGNDINFLSSSIDFITKNSLVSTMKFNYIEDINSGCIPAGIDRSVILDLDNKFCNN